MVKWVVLFRMYKQKKTPFSLTKEKRERSVPLIFFVLCFGFHFLQGIRFFPTDEGIFPHHVAEVSVDGNDDPQCTVPIEHDSISHS
jgi:succinate dehydrogenase/fumarate reductase cytochrome b subunit